MGDAEKRMGRGELAKELRDVATWLRGLVPKTATELIAGQHGTLYEALEAIEAAAALLEDDSLERNARRYQAIKRLKRFKDPDKYFLVIDDCLGLHSCHKNNVECFKHAGFWRESLDAAIDAWLEGEGNDQRAETCTQTTRTAGS